MATYRFRVNDYGEGFVEIHRRGQPWSDLGVAYSVPINPMRACGMVVEAILADHLGGRPTELRLTGRSDADVAARSLRGFLSAQIRKDFRAGWRITSTQLTDWIVGRYNPLMGEAIKAKRLRANDP